MKTVTQEGFTVEPTPRKYTSRPPTPEEREQYRKEAEAHRAKRTPQEHLAILKRMDEARAGGAPTENASPQKSNKQ